MEDHGSSRLQNDARDAKLEGHTPGPWVVVSGLRNNGHGHPDYRRAAPFLTPMQTIIGGDGSYVVSAKGLARPASQNGQANARLIAAAPELLAALTDLAASYEGVCSNLPFGVMGRSEIAADLAPARAAIAKATGQ